MLTRTLSALLAAAVLAAGCENPSGSRRPGPPAQMEIVAGDEQRDTVGQQLPQPLVVRVVDERGRPVPDQIINFRVTAGGGSVFAGSALTNRDGEARERWTLGTAAGDTQRVEARAVDPQTGAALVLGTFKAVGLADGPHHLQAVSAPLLAGRPGGQTTEAPVVRVLDRHRNRVPGAVVTWVPGAGSGSAPSTSQADSAGRATVAWTLGPTADPQTLGARLGAETPVQFSARLLLPRHVAYVSGPTALQPGQSGDYTFIVRDSLNLPYGDTPVEWTLVGPGGTLSNASARTAADGTATVRLTAGPTATDFALGLRAGTAAGGVNVSVSSPVAITDVSVIAARGLRPVTGVSARIASTAGAVTGAVLTVAGRQGTMTYNADTRLWHGGVDMTGLAAGTHTGTLTARDAAGNERAATFTTHYTPNPVVLIVEPEASTVTRTGSVRVRATCSWQAAEPGQVCANLFSSVHSGSTVYVPAATGRSEIDVTIALPAQATTLEIVVSWFDRSAINYLASDTVTVHVTP